MTSREELIEEAAKAMCERAGEEEWEDCPQDWYRADAKAALKVFEQAHTPTDDERVPGFAEREKRAARAWELFARDDREMSHDFRSGYHRGMIDGFRRTVQGEPTATSIPRYAMLDVWMALYGHENSQAFDGFYEGARYAEAWATLLAAIRARAGEPQGEPTDAQVIHALEAYWGPQSTGLWFADQIKSMRRALRAAAEATNREVGSE